MSDQIKFLKFFSNPSYLKLKNSFYNYRLRRFFINKELDRIDLSGGNVLEIGSGISPITDRQRHNVIYSELSHDAVEFMNTRMGLKTVQDDITKSGFDSSSYDLIVSSEVFEHIKNDSAAFKEVSRILKPGGFFILSVPVHAFYWAKDDELVGHFRRYTDREIEVHFANAGMKLIKRVKIGNPVERVMCIAMARAFMKSGLEEKKRPPADVLVSAFAVVNTFLFYLARLFVFLTPARYSSINLYVGQK